MQLAPPEQPFSLKIEKTGPASCAPGSECPFDITLTNTGSKDHKGAVTLTDGLSNAPAMSIFSIEPPLPCTEQPADIPFTCRTRDDFSIPTGGKRTFRITARVPRSAETFTNCAVVSPGKSRQGTGAKVEAASCATVKSATPPASTRETPQCRGGMILMDEGACACLPNQTWNGRTCAEPPLPNRIPESGGSGPIELQICPPDRPVGDFPNCCPVGTRYAHGVCRRPSTGGEQSGGTNGTQPTRECTGERPIGTYPNCCPVGTRYAHGVCRRPSTGGEQSGGTNGTPGTKTCTGDRPVGTYPNCCPMGTRYAHGICRRPSTGGEQSGGTNGAQPTRECTGERPIGTYPNCCPVGTRYAHGVCRRPSTGGEQSGGTNGTPGTKTCTGDRPVGTYPNCCPEGTVYTGHLCRRLHGSGSGATGNGGTSGTKSCPPGTHATHFGRCRKNTSPTQTPKTT